MLPRIAVNPAYKTPNPAYKAAISAANGDPFDIEPATSPQALRQQLEKAAGLLLIGGPDVSGIRAGYNPSHNPERLIESHREDCDFALAAAALEMDLPILAICLGCQILNVAYGGTLHAHLPDAHLKPHICHKLEEPRHHAVQLAENSRMARIAGVLSVETNSRHHQGIRNLGDGLIATGHTDDGLAEVVEDPRRAFTIGIQWHPEDITKFHPHGAIFDTFVQACRAYLTAKDKSR